MKRSLALLILIITGLWILQLLIAPPAPVIRAWVREGLYFTGILAWTCMAMAVIIAARPAWIEKVTNTPLDQLYLLHKKLGISAACLAALHFFCKDILGFLLSDSGMPRGDKQMVDAFVASLSIFPSGFKNLLESAGEWLTYLALILMIITFVSAISYSRWLSMHRLFSIIFLLLSPHALFLMGQKLSITPLGIYNIVITLIGCWFSLKLLLQGPGAACTHQAQITEVSHHGNITIFTVKPERDIRIKPGQFMFLKIKGHEKHPFSVAGIRRDGSVLFTVKALGDYTRDTVPKFAVGDKIILEGPWGNFLPHLSMHSQLWVAGGIGIAPFLSWLDAFDGRTHGSIKLIWLIRDKAKDPLSARVMIKAEQADIALSIIESRNGRFDSDTLFRSGLPDEIALCASSSLAASVSRAFVTAGGSKKAIRKEHFTWRG